MIIKGDVVVPIDNRIPKMWVVFVLLVDKSLKIPLITRSLIIVTTFEGYHRVTCIFVEVYKIYSRLAL